MMRMFSRRRRELVCRQAVTLMSDYLDNILAARDRERLELHLAECDDCTEYLAQLRATLSVSGTIEPESLTPAALNDLVEVYRRWISG
jgi:anti-sigma factor RsiW